MKEHLYAAGIRLAAGSIDITPNTSLPGTSLLQSILGGIMLWSELALALGFILACVAWGIGHHQGNYKLAQQGRQGLLVVVVAIILVGSMNAIVNAALTVNLGVTSI
jgi:hypothetical protein